MKFLLIGAGAIGTYVGGSLLAAGYPVAFLEQPGPAAALRKNGLLLKIGTDIRSLPVTAVYTSAAEALRKDTVDLIVFALKCFDTDAAIRSLKACGEILPPILCLQNGVENETALADAFGAGCIIAGTVTSAVGRESAGAITLERKRGVGVAAGHALSRPILEAMNRAGLNARIFSDGRAMKWSKMLTNLLANASSAILGMTPHEIFSDPRLFSLEREMLRECLLVMRAQRIPVVDLPGTPVRLLALAVERLPRALAQPALVRAVGGGRGGKMPSFYLDLHSGRGKTEVQWLNGAVSRFGERYGLATPVNRILTETLERLVDGREKKADFLRQPQKLLGLRPPGTIS